MLLLWFLVGLALGQVPIVVDAGTLAEGNHLVVGRNGAVWLLTKPGVERGGGIARFFATSADDEQTLPQLVRVGDKGVETFDITGFGEGESYNRMVLEMGPKGPIVAIEGQYCYESGKKTICHPRLWTAILSKGVAQVKRLPTEDGANYRGVALNVRNGVRSVAVGYAEEVTEANPNPWKGVLLYTDGTPERWFETPRLSRPQRLVWADGRLQLTYRRGTTLYLYDGYTELELGKGARHMTDAIGLTDGRVAWQFYDAGGKRLRGGAGAMPASDLGRPESGWFNAVAQAPDGQVYNAWYYLRNNYNKGIMFARWGEPPVSLVRSEEFNIGWRLDMDIGADGTVGVVALNRSTGMLEVRRYPSVQAAIDSAVPAAGDWTDKRRDVFLFLYGGGWYQWWDVNTAPPSDENFSYGDVPVLSGAYGISPGLGVQGGFAGKVGPVNLVLEYMRRQQDDPAFQQINKLQNLMGKLGIDDLPMPDSEMQLHLSTADLSGTYVDAAGVANAFTTGDRVVELRYVGKEGYHFGLQYHQFSGPQDVYVSLNRVLLSSFVADATFDAVSVVGGWAVLDYLKKYEVEKFAPYVDFQGGAGFVSTVLAPRTSTGVSPLGATLGADTFGTTPTGGTTGTAGLATVATTEKDVAFAGQATLDLGWVAYKRFKRLYGTGLFARAGARGYVHFVGTGEPEDRESEDGEPLEPMNNFSRLDLRYGPYLNVGLVF